MTNTKSIFAAIIIAIFALTSCQKENMSELSQNAISTQSRTTPETNVVNKAIKTQFTERMKAAQATSRNGSTDILTCGSGIINDNTASSDNYFDAINSPCLDGSGDFFDGLDKSYSFLVEHSSGESVRRSIILSKMQQDLDLFVFALDSDGFISECVATSITHGLEDEVLELGNLAPGYYEIVVDGWHKNIKSSFELIYYCSASQEVPADYAKTKVNKVIIGDPSGKEAAIVQQLSATEWSLKVVGSSELIKATEVKRDNNNIYLKSDTGAGYYQINLISNEFLVGDPENLIPYAYILATSSEINGYFASTISLGKDGQLVGKFYRQFDLIENKEIWVSDNQTDYFYSLSKDENNIFMNTPDGFGILQFDLDKMKVIIETENTYDEIYDILNFE